MNKKTSIFLSLGVSAVLIAAAIWFIDSYSTGIWRDDGRWGMNTGHMMGGSMGVVMVLFWVVLIGAIVLLISGAVNGIQGNRSSDNNPPSPIEILERRYASGEIDRAEYEEKRRDLTS